MISKKMLSQLIAMLLITAVVFNITAFNTYAQVSQPSGATAQSTVGFKEEAVAAWLLAQQDTDGAFKNHTSVNDTSDAIAILRAEGKTCDTTFLEEYERDYDCDTIDELAHLSWGLNDEGYLEYIWGLQREDGGFGLTESYTSEVYDTALVLLVTCALQSNGEEEATSQTDKEEVSTSIYQVDKRQLALAVHYLSTQQNADGGFGYHGNAASDACLSARIGLALQMLAGEETSIRNHLDDYCKQTFTGVLDEDVFLEQATLAAYLYSREMMKNVEIFEKRLVEVLDESSSVYQDVQDTIAYLLLVRQIAEYHTLRLSVTGITSELNSYVLEANKEQTLHATSTVSYQTNQTVDARVRYRIEKDGKIVVTEQKEVTLSSDAASIRVEADMKVKAEEEGEYNLIVEVFRDESILNKETKQESVKEEVKAQENVKLHVHVSKQQEFKLKAEVKEGSDYGVNLSWNELSDEDNQYGYRVFRKKGDGDWESRSTWDGAEKVKVLNVYPCEEAKNYLKDWMTQTINNSVNLAGKGLFDIDTVWIEKYNRNPDEYLKDKNGVYKYDVLMFGTYDGNSFEDLTEKSYEATQDFIDTGRGVLFGHDTVTANDVVNNPMFAKFEKQLGVKLKWDGRANPCNRVKIVNSGFLTSYPWKLTGELTIPYAHCLGQYTSGKTDATVWMEFDSSYYTDEETGGKNNAYLFTRNALAMIQTGHSCGAATDDERKIVANTLFYLKQLTKENNVKDQSFYDEAAPEVTKVTEQDDGTIKIHARDIGTEYKYYVQAVSTKDKEGLRDSNYVSATACSGVQGYVIGCSDTEDAMESLIQKDEKGKLVSTVLQAEDGVLSYKPSEFKNDQEQYVHIYAVDDAGNISKEVIHKVPKIKQEGANDKKVYLNLPYALFASENELSIHCSSAGLLGDVYGKKTVEFQGSVLKSEGSIGTTGILSLVGGMITVGERKEGMVAVKLPNYMKAIREDMEKESEKVEHISAYNSTKIMNPTMCKSTTGTWCPDVNVEASLVSKEAVNFNANTVTCAGTNPVVLASEKGDVTIQATILKGDGLIYAPNGTVTINVNQWDYKGSVVAKKIKIQASIVNIKK